MKKVLALLFVSMLIATGCSTNAANEILDASKKMEGLKSYSVKMTMDVGVESEGQTVSTKVVMDMDIDSVSNQTKTLLNMTIPFLGAMELTMYAEKNDDQVTTYTENFLGEGWTKKTTYAENADSFDDTKLYNFAEGSFTVNRLSSDAAGEKKYEMTISKDKFNEMMQGLEESMRNEELQLKDDITFILVIKDGYIKSMSFDLLEYLNNSQEEYTYTKADIVMEISDYNNVTVSIPSDVINSAVESE